MLPLVSLFGCHTTEANYRAAYEKAKNHRDSWDGIEGTVYEAIRRESMPSELIFDGVKIPTRKIRVKTVDDKPLADRYLIVGQFKQLFTANSMCKRLKEAGYADASLLVTPEPLYYVAATEIESDQAAVAEYLNFFTHPAFSIREPFPWLLITVK